MPGGQERKEAVTMAKPPLGVRLSLLGTFLCVFHGMGMSGCCSGCRR